MRARIEQFRSDPASMKIQYLGDSKDSFKWDYHDYLVDSLGYGSLNIVLMMTPDDNGSHGSSRASRYPARADVINFCQMLSENRVLSDIRDLPKATSSDYEVRLHSESCLPNENLRRQYFEGFTSEIDQIVLIDPDNGFEPHKSYSDKHLLFSELDQVLGQISERSVISVFQHFRRKPFERDFVEIRERILGGYSTAVFWHSLMFVLVTRSSDVLKQLIRINELYASERPVRVIK